MQRLYLVFVFTDGAGQCPELQLNGAGFCGADFYEAGASSLEIDTVTRDAGRASKARVQVIT